MDPILDLAAKLFGCKRSELIEVRDLSEGGLSVIAKDWQRKTFSVEEVTAAQPDRDWSIIDGELVTTTPIDISDGIDEAEAAFAGRVLAQRKRETEEAAKALNVRKTTKL